MICRAMSMACIVALITGSANARDGANGAWRTALTQPHAVPADTPADLQRLNKGDELAVLEGASRQVLSYFPKGYHSDKKSYKSGSKKSYKSGGSKKSKKSYKSKKSHKSKKSKKSYNSKGSKKSYKSKKSGGSKKSGDDGYDSDDGGHYRYRRLLDWLDLPYEDHDESAVVEGDSRQLLTYYPNGYYDYDKKSYKSKKSGSKKSYKSKKSNKSYKSKKSHKSDDSQKSKKSYKSKKSHKSDDSKKSKKSDDGYGGYYHRRLLMGVDGAH